MTNHIRPAFCASPGSVFFLPSWTQLVPESAQVRVAAAGRLCCSDVTHGDVRKLTQRGILFPFLVFLGRGSH